MLLDAKKDYLVQFMADMILVAKAAEAKKMADTPEFKRRIAFARDKRPMGEALAIGRQGGVPTRPCTKSMTTRSNNWVSSKRRARHILIRAAPGDEKASKEAEDKIKAIIVRLKKGEDFEKLAKELTEDPSGKANGGDLGYFTKDQMVPEFSETAFKLEKGQISEWVQSTESAGSQGRGHSQEAPPEEVKAQIENFVTRKAQAELVQKPLRPRSRRCTRPRSRPSTEYRRRSSFDYINQ